MKIEKHISVHFLMLEWEGSDSDVQPSIDYEFRGHLCRWLQLVFVVELYPGSGTFPGHQRYRYTGFYNYRLV